MSVSHTNTENLDEHHLTLSVINSFAKDLLKVNSKKEIAWAVTKNAINKLGFEDCIVYLFDNDRLKLLQYAAHGPKNPSGYVIENLISIPIGQGIVGSVAQSGRYELINDTSEDERYIKDDRIRLSELAVPILLDNQTIGVIDSEHSEKDFFTSYHLKILETIASMVSNRLGHIKSHDELEKHKNELVAVVDKKTKNLSDTVSLLQLSNKEISAFNHAIAHDLREPLRSICSFSELVLNKSRDMSDKNKGHLKRVVDCAKNMDIMLSGLLSLSSVDLSRMEKTEVDLNRVLNKVQKNLSLHLESFICQFHFNSLPSIRGYESLLIQLFQNILANSINYRQKNEDLIIKIKFEDKEDFIKMSVTDNGIGFNADESVDPFKLFSRLENAKTYEGEGIGLSLCKRIVYLHQGTISISSSGLNQGTTVEFNLQK